MGRREIRTTPAEGSTKEAAAGIFQLTVSTPLPVGPVNSYLLTGHPLTLVDGGPGLAKTLVVLDALIRETENRLEDVEAIVLTHQHVDHIGLARLVAERSGAEVIALEPAAEYVEDFEVNQARTDRFRQELMRRHGVETDVVGAFASLTNMYAALGSSVTVSRRLDDGESVRLGGRDYTAFHRPGHSPTDTIFYDPERRVLISGDHLLPKISSNALISPEGDHGVTRPLLDYRASLNLTRNLDVELILGGHGEVSTGHGSLIEHRLQAQAHRAEELFNALEDGPLSAVALAENIWGPMKPGSVFLMLSEVLGHLDLLIEAGRVVQVTDAGVPEFHATSAKNRPAATVVADTTRRVKT